MGSEYREFHLELWKFIKVEIFMSAPASALLADDYEEIITLNTLLYLFTVKFLEVIKPFCSILPEVTKPERKVS